MLLLPWCRAEFSLRRIDTNSDAPCPYNCDSVHNESEQTGRLLGLDVGSRTIGLAVSDPLGITAQGMPTYRRKNKRTDFEFLDRLIREHEIREIVVGYPLKMKTGGQTAGSERMTVFAEELRERFGLPVHLWDERLTTAEASRVLRESEMSIKRRGEVVDQLAAVLILQSFMENRQHSSLPALDSDVWE